LPAEIHNDESQQTVNWESQNARRFSVDFFLNSCQRETPLRVTTNCQPRISKRVSRFSFDNLAWFILSWIGVGGGGGPLMVVVEFGNKNRDFVSPPKNYFPLTLIWGERINGFKISTTAKDTNILFPQQKNLGLTLVSLTVIDKIINAAPQITVIIL